MPSPQWVLTQRALNLLKEIRSQRDPLVREAAAIAIARIEGK